jgi:hypothetical protein
MSASENEQKRWIANLIKKIPRPTNPQSDLSRYKPNLNIENERDLVFKTVAFSGRLVGELV